MESGSIDGANIVFREGVCQEVRANLSQVENRPPPTAVKMSALHRAKKCKIFAVKAKKARWFAIFLRSEAAVSKNYINLAADYGYVCP